MRPVLTEIGQVRATNEAGESVDFTPSFFAMARIGLPHEIVETFADLFKPVRDHIDGVPCASEIAANAVLCACSDSEYAAEFIDQIPVNERIILAAHLMKHGISGNEKRRSKSNGKYSDRFDPAEFIDAAMLHFGLTFDDAGSLTMTRFVKMMKMKYPQSDDSEKYPDREAFDKARVEYLARKAKQNGNASR